MTQTYKNNRKGFLTDLYVDTTPIGAIVPNLKTISNSYDQSYVKAGAATFPTLSEQGGDAYQSGDDPAYTHEGYLYCDGKEYDINDFPALYEIIGNQYGGLASNGIDVVTPGSGYTINDTVTISAPGGTGTTALASIQELTATNGIKRLSVTNVGTEYTSEPTVTISGSSGSGATFKVRISQGTIRGISTQNVMNYLGQSYLGTFCVPDTKARKIVGNGPVFGNNSPNIGNSQMGTGNTGGAWYLDQDRQDDLFSLGRIVTTGYENVTETTECTIVGSQTVELSMRETKLSGPPQHTHLVYHTIPGDEQWATSINGDRYLVQYKQQNGRVSRYYPQGVDTVLTHEHGLLRKPNVDTDVATYDVFDWQGGASGCGSIKDPLVADGGTTTDATDLEFLASGETGAGTYEFQTFIKEPEFKKFANTSIIGGRTWSSGGEAVYEFSDEWEWTNTSGSDQSYSINLGNITGGTPAILRYLIYGGGGSGAAGNVEGNDGTATRVQIGSIVDITAGGGKKGNAAAGLQGGLGGAGGTASSSGSFTPSGLQSGGDGANGGNGATVIGFPKADYPNNPDNGGSGYPIGQDGGQASFGSDGINLEIGGQSGTYTDTASSDKDFSTEAGFQAISGYPPTQVQFTLEGGMGGNPSYGGCTGGAAAFVTLTITDPTKLATFYNQGWSVFIGSAGTSNLNYGGEHIGGYTGVAGTNGTNTLGANGGFGGWGSDNNGNNYMANGGGGGAATVLRRASQIVAGAGGGGGAGAAGWDGGPCEAGRGTPEGAGLQAEATSTIGTGTGGSGGRYGCVGGGGGGGGGGVARSGFTFNGGVSGDGSYANGGGSAGPGGAPGNTGGHQGGEGAWQGISSYRTLYFDSGNKGDSTRGDGYATLEIKYNNDHWTSGGGGGGQGGSWDGDVQWTDLNSPGSVQVTVGHGGAAVNPGGNTSGSTSSGGGGYAKIGVGKITGYIGATTEIKDGSPIIEGSQTTLLWDIDIVSGGTGTGSSGDFKLPTTQVPILVVRGGGATTDAEGTVQIGNGSVSGVTLTSPGSGYTETPYTYVLNGAGASTKVASNVDTAAGTVSTLQYIAGSSTPYNEKYLKFGGLSGSAGTRWAIVEPTDCSACNYFSIKAARGNGVNGGNVPEESLRVYYQKATETGWTLIDTIITPSVPRQDPLIGNVPAVSEAWDGASGDTQWYTYSVAMPTDAKEAGVKIKLEQPRQTPSNANDNDPDTDHYGICEIIFWNEKVSELVFVETAGAINKAAVETLSYTVQGETGAGVTYSSGLGSSDAKLTLRRTTPIEPQATIDPDYHVSLITPYRLCKYLIKAF